MPANRTTKVSLVAEVSGYVAGFDKASKATRELGTESEKLAQKKEALNTLGAGLLAIGAVAAVGVGLAVAKFAEFDQAISNVKAATQETTSNMALLREAALDAGASSVFSATEAANAIEELGKAGLTTQQILGGGLDGALSLAAAGQLDVADAAQIAAIAVKQFNLEGSDVPHVADLLAAGAGKAVGDVSDLAAALGQAGLVANQTGLSIEETTGVLAAFADKGLLGSDAGTSLKTMLQSLVPSSEAAAKEMDRLGISAYDANGEFIGAAKFAGNYKNALKDLTPEQQASTAKIIFGSDAVRAANVFYELGAEGIEKYVEQTNDVGYAAQVARDRLDNLAGDVEKLGGSFDTALIRSGSGANDVLRGLTQTATFLIDAVGGIPGPALSAGLAVTAVGAGVAITGGAALIAVPKVAAFKSSLIALEISSKTAALGIGLAGGAIAIATIGLGVYITAQMEAKARVDAFGETLDAATNKITNSTRELAMANLAAKDSFLWFESDSTYTAAKKLGLGLDTITDAATGNVDALKKLRGELDVGKIGSDSYKDALKESGLTHAEFAAATAAVEKGVQGESSSIAEAIKVAKQKQEVDAETAASIGGVASAAGDLTAGLADVGAAATDAGADIETLAGQIAGFGQATFDSRSATRELEAAIDDASQALIDNGTSLDVNEDKGRANSAALDGIAAAANAAAAARVTETGAADSATVALGRGRDALLAQLAAYGITGDAAEDYVSTLLATPAQVKTQVELNGVAAAQAGIDRLNTGLGAFRSAMAGLANGSAGQGLGVLKASANGNMFSYANGGMGEGIYNGRAGALYKFAEPETGWEAFISGRPGQEQRNKEIWADAGNRLGIPTPSYLPATTQQFGSGSTTNSRAGDTFTINGAADPLSVALTVSRRQNMLGAV